MTDNNDSENENEEQNEEKPKFDIGIIRNLLIDEHGKTYITAAQGKDTIRIKAENIEGLNIIEDADVEYDIDQIEWITNRGSPRISADLEEIEDDTMGIRSVSFVIERGGLGIFD